MASKKRAIEKRLERLDKLAKEREETMARLIALGFMDEDELPEYRYELEGEEEKSAHT